MAELVEIRRVADWGESGDVECPCGQTLHLYFNGGELDERVCRCGLLYRTEHTAIDLVVLGPAPEASDV